MLYPPFYRGSMAAIFLASSLNLGCQPGPGHTSITRAPVKKPGVAKSLIGYGLQGSSRIETALSMAESEAAPTQVVYATEEQVNAALETANAAVVLAAQAEARAKLVADEAAVALGKALTALTAAGVSGDVAEAAKLIAQAAEVKAISAVSLADLSKAQAETAAAQAALGLTKATSAMEQVSNAVTRSQQALSAAVLADDKASSAIAASAVADAKAASASSLAVLAEAQARTAAANSTSAATAATAAEVKALAAEARSIAVEAIAKQSADLARAADSQASSALVQVQTLLERLSTLETKASESLSTANSALALANSIKSQRPVNVADFGAKGDGVNDDTMAIQSAIDSIRGKGGKVEFPPGRYLVNPFDAKYGYGGIRVYSNIELDLGSAGSLVAKPTSSGVSAVISIIGETNVRISGGTVTGEREGHLGTGGEWGHGIYCVSSNNVTFYNLTVKNCWGDGIYVGKDVSGRVVAPVASSYAVNIVNCVSTNNRRNGLSIVSANNVSVMGGAFSSTNGTSPQSGIALEPNNSDIQRDIRIQGAHFEGNYGDGIYAIRTHGVTVNGCTFKDNRSIAIKPYYDCKDISIVGNVIGGTVGEGISSIFQPLDRNHTYGVAIKNNIIRVPGYPLAFFSANVRDLVIENNLVYFDSPSAFPVKISSNTDSYIHILKGNTFIVNSELTSTTNMPASVAVSTGKTLHVDNVHINHSAIPVRAADMNGQRQYLKSGLYSSLFSGDTTSSSLSGEPVLFENDEDSSSRVITDSSAIQPTDNVVHLNMSAAISLTLPGAAAMTAYKGKKIVVKDISGIASTSNVTIRPGAGTTYEAGPAYVFKTNFGSVTFYLDGSIWRTR